MTNTYYSTMAGGKVNGTVGECRGCHMLGRTSRKHSCIVARSANTKSLSVKQTTVQHAEIAAKRENYPQEGRISARPPELAAYGSA